ncbi:Protein of unknown function (DUF2892) [Thermoflavifilum aggregans]|uniref:Inner membrane protein YgaP-like transmembrane domain-containing protein n=1 Tax=Thermoflavifilum aggregans TaxID=454188 RepID=A0A2M9CXV7_9BACT|nr:DUF2892 domain-containing protein [Thermoflavifilum aggregans]MBX6379142.1 DUF2892 domain-containing protein [Thermoflavifilum aggregans]PJJ76740.1 Protein of unknown function (DUF2892) [Thermoflavifilum aggregans]
MKRNISTADRIIRFIVAIVLGILYFNHTVTGTWGVILLIIGIVLFITALVNFCPLYRILGISTCKVKQ